MYPPLLFANAHAVAVFEAALATRALGKRIVYHERTQSTSADTERDYAVIGIGLNINQTLDELPETAKAPPTSMRIEAGEPFDRQAVFECVLEKLEQNLERLCSAGARAQIRATVDARL